MADSGGDEVDRAIAAIRAGRVADEVESATLDFKRQQRSRDDTAKDLAEAVSCFANSQGGTVVVGVRDRARGAEAFEGTSLDQLWLSRRIYEITHPPVIVSIEERAVDGVRLLLLSVPRSPDIHQVNQRATHRVGTSCVPMTAAQIAVALADRRGDDWSAADSNVDISEASAVALEIAFDLLRRNPDPVRRRYATETDRDLFRILGVVNQAGRFTNAGALLFTATPDDPVQIVYQYRRTPAGEPLVMHRLSRPLLPALLRVLELIDARVDKTPVNLPRGQQVQFADLPEGAVREAVVNAVTHRDYRLGGPVQIEHAPTRLLVTSPGPLVAGVTVDNILTTTSRPRNPALATAIRVLGLAEEAGVGVDRMYRDMVRVGHQPPAYTVTPDQVAVRLSGGAPNRHVARYAATLPEPEQDDADTLLILYYLLTHRTVSAPAARTLLQKGAEETQEVLIRLSTEPVAMLEPTRETARRRFPHYRLRSEALSALGPAVSYRRGHTGEAEQKVVELVAASGQLNARMVRVVLDLDAPAASRLLRDLVRRQVLVRTSEATRGPGVTYGPGPRFPRTRTR